MKMIVMAVVGSTDVPRDRTKLSKFWNKIRFVITPWRLDDAKLLIVAAERNKQYDDCGSIWKWQFNPKYKDIALFAGFGKKMRIDDEKFTMRPAKDCKRLVMCWYRKRAERVRRSTVETFDAGWASYCLDSHASHLDGSAVAESGNVESWPWCV